MRRIKDIVSKPSQLIIAMCDGLEKQNKRRSFRVRMDTFGASRGKVCYGCAATCALSDIFGYFSIKMPPRGRISVNCGDRHYFICLKILRAARIESEAIKENAGK